MNIHQDLFSASSHSKVCFSHFTSDQLIEPQSTGRRLITQAVLVLFVWNKYTIQPPWPSMWKRRERPVDVIDVEPIHVDVMMDHD